MEGRNIFVAGQTGSGKTHLVKQQLGELDRVLVYLPKREDYGYTGVYFDALKGERESFLFWWSMAQERCRRWRLVYRPADKFDADEFDGICRLVYLAGNCTFIAEDIGGYLSSRIFQTVGRYMGIKTLLIDGRTRGITAYWLTQRPFGIPREITSESRDAYVFCLQEPADRDYVEDRFGLAARQGLEQLQPYQHVHWVNTGAVEVSKA
jgi:hypothetical protein